MGGEKTTSTATTCPPSGSPPRRRGKEVADEGIGGIIRITPAWAGKRPSWQVWKPDTKDHPRVGREKASTMTSVSPSKGSPPRRRGKETVQAIFEGDKGITPAWAGKRRSHGAAALQSGDHPRMGGEKRKASSCSCWVSGSSPRGRGKARAARLRWKGGGITPA